MKVIERQGKCTLSQHCSSHGRCQPIYLHCIHLLISPVNAPLFYPSHLSVSPFIYPSIPLSIWLYVIKSQFPPFNQQLFSHTCPSGFPPPPSLPPLFPFSPPNTARGGLSRPSTAIQGIAPPSKILSWQLYIFSSFSLSLISLALSLPLPHHLSALAFLSLP